MRTLRDICDGQMRHTRRPLSARRDTTGTTYASQLPRGTLLSVLSCKQVCTPVVPSKPKEVDSWWFPGYMTSIQGYPLAGVQLWSCKPHLRHDSCSKRIHCQRMHPHAFEGVPGALTFTALGDSISTEACQRGQDICESDSSIRTSGGEALELHGKLGLETYTYYQTSTHRQ